MTYFDNVGQFEQMFDKMLDVEYSNTVSFGVGYVHWKDQQYVSLYIKGV